MLKCWFLGHDWKLEKTYTGTRTSYLWFGKLVTDHKLCIEYYKCSKCGKWIKKTFVDHQLQEIEYFNDCPIEQGEQNDNTSKHTKK